jgi:hypothetical protein
VGRRATWCAAPPARSHSCRAPQARPACRRRAARAHGGHAGPAPLGRLARRRVLRRDDRRPRHRRGAAAPRSRRSCPSARARAMAGGSISSTPGSLPAPRAGAASTGSSCRRPAPPTSRRWRAAPRGRRAGRAPRRRRVRGRAPRAVGALPARRGGGVARVAIVLPGRSFAGKTTLTAALLRRGAEYYSDEYAVLDHGGRVHPFARPLRVRPPEGGPARWVSPASLGARVGTAAIRWASSRPRASRGTATGPPSRCAPGRPALTLLDNAPVARARPAHAMARIAAALHPGVSRCAAPAARPTRRPRGSSPSRTGSRAEASGARRRRAAERLFALLGEAREVAGIAALPERGWASLCAQAAWHGVLPLLALRLRERGLAPHVPAQSLRTLDAAYTLGSLRAAALPGAAARGRRHARGAGRARRAAQGGARGRGAVRRPGGAGPWPTSTSSSPADRLDAARGGLGAIGYRPVASERADFEVHRHDRPLVRAGRLAVELHRAIEPCSRRARSPSPERVGACARRADRGHRDARARTPRRPAAAPRPTAHESAATRSERPVVSVCDVAGRGRASAPPLTDYRAAWPRAAGAGGRFVYAALAVAARTLDARGAARRPSPGSTTPFPTSRPVAAAGRLLRGATGWCPAKSRAAAQSRSGRAR